MSKQLGINQDLDKLARENELGHWSCVSPLSYSFWIRSDGRESHFSSFYDEISIFSILKNMDYYHPIDKDWQQPSYSYQVGFDIAPSDGDKSVIFELNKPTLVQKTFQHPCDGALYFEEKSKKQVFISEKKGKSIRGYIEPNEWRNYDLNGKIKDVLYGTEHENLIMFEWE
jgi:hypothetical protein